MTWTAHRHHEISLMCDDLDATMPELTQRGARFRGEPEQEVFGRVAMLTVPGADDLMLYEPSHPVAHTLRGGGCLD